MKRKFNLFCSAWNKRHSNEFVLTDSHEALENLFRSLLSNPNINVNSVTFVAKESDNDNVVIMILNVGIVFSALVETVKGGYWEYKRYSRHRALHESQSRTVEVEGDDGSITIIIGPQNSNVSRTTQSDPTETSSNNVLENLLPKHIAS